MMNSENLLYEMEREIGSNQSFVTHKFLYFIDLFYCLHKN